ALLTVDGYQVEQADCGQSALSRVSRQQPDLILLDVMMPGLDGFEVCRQLKQNEYTRLIPVIFITALGDRESRLKGIEAGGDDFLTKPFDQLELSARVKSLIHQKRLNEDLDHAEKVLFSIARTIESRDPNTGDHCDRLAKLVRAFGEYLRLSPLNVRNLVWGAYLHDIGKVGIPDGVLLKTGPLEPNERAIMEQHVLIGENICRPLRTMRGVVPIIRHHHERWNGTGYPDGLVGSAIPQLAQIFQLVDIFDALVHSRPYKPALMVQQALDIMWAEVEQGWRDPELMAQFETFIKQHELTDLELENHPWDFNWSLDPLASRN
ncbi:MAG TPA: response regulator, partial [Leptolyngbyaceae cyanobacterium M65_K2018_010]|nr:response regulator [Leptolyngbyaceae cyanobacterium M65_K2018_010]